jgi:hypothetical protein
MANAEIAPTYIDVTTQTYLLVLDALATTQKRVLDHARNHYEIIARPFTATTPDANIREAFDRANQIAAITAAELQTTAQKNAEFAEKILKHAAKVQAALLSAWQGFSNTGLSNLKYARETADGQVNAFAKGVGEVQELQRRTTAAASSSSKN